MRRRPCFIGALLTLAVAAVVVPTCLIADPGLLAPAPASAKTVQVENQDGAAPPATTLDGNWVHGILGSAVRSAADEDMGRVVDIIVDRFGTARAAIIDFGGFLGVGSRRIAIDWNAIQFTGPDRITLDMTRSQVKAAPEYRANSNSIVVLGASPEFARSRVTERTPEP